MENTKRTKWWVSTLAILSASCMGDMGEETAKLRVVAAADPQSHVSLRVDNEVVADGSAAEVLGRYIDVSPGLHEVELSGAKSSENTVQLVAGARATLIVAPNGKRQVISDETMNQAAGKTNARFINASSQEGAIDVFVSAPPERLETLAPVVFDLAHSDVSGYHDLVGAPQRIRATTSGDATAVLFDSGIVSLPTERHLSIIIMDRPAGGLQLTVLTEQGSTQLMPFDPCAADVADNDVDHARLLKQPFVLDGLCEDNDVDVYEIRLASAQLAVIELSTSDLGSDLEGAFRLTDRAGTVIDQAAQIDGNDATTRILLFGGASYYLTVADQYQTGSATHTYGLNVSFASASPKVAATGGHFTGASNDQSISAFSGNFVALSVTGADGKPVDYKVQVAVTGAAGEDYRFTFAPEQAEDSVMRVLLTEGDAWLPTVKSLTIGDSPALFRAFPGWYGVHATGAQSRNKAATRSVVVGFPTSEVKFQIPESGALDVPTVTAAQLNDDSTKVRVTFTAPARAKQFNTTLFTREGAEITSIASVRSPVTAALKTPIAADDAFVVQVRASDRGALAMPLPKAPLNVSEFLFYSDAE